MSDERIFPHPSLLTHRSSIVSTYSEHFLKGQPLYSNQNPKLSYNDYLRFRDLVMERSGLYFPEKKKQDLEAGLFKTLSESSLYPNGVNNSTPNLDDYYNLLRDRNNPASLAEMNHLINALTVGETHFFRNEAQFDALTAQVLPALIARKRAMAAAVGPDIQPQLRIWSAGCATGEEPYSLAILLKEILPDIDNWYILILATDINQDSLNLAREARYTDWSFRESRAKNLQPKYFTNEPVTNNHQRIYYRLKENIKQMVSFAPLNLNEDEYPAIHNNTASMDLILCRNVTIYFTEDTTRKLVRQFHSSLVNGGWLVVGHSEPSLVIYRAFQAHSFSNTLFYQKTGQSTPWPDDWEWLNQPGYPTPSDILKAQQPIVQRPTQAEEIILTEKNPPALGTPSGKDEAPVVTPALTSPAEVDSYEIAFVLLNKGHTEEAINELHQKLTSDPNFAPAHSLLGRAYANRGEWAEARRWCRSALKLDSLQSEAYYVLALIDDHEGQLKAGIQHLNRAVYIERDNPLFHFNLAALHKKAGHVDRARRACRNAIKILEKWPPGSIVPDTGGATAKHLLDAAHRIMHELEGIQ